MGLFKYDESRKLYILLFIQCRGLSHEVYFSQVRLLISGFVHFDIGSQYCSNNYYQIVEQHKLKGSMSRRSNCFDYTLIKTSRVRSTAQQGRMSRCITKTIKQDSKPLAISLNILNQIITELEFKRVQAVDRQGRCSLTFTVRLRN